MYSREWMAKMRRKARKKAEKVAAEREATRTQGEKVKKTKTLDKGAVTSIPKRSVA
jgi:hypothetical protein